MGCTIAASSLRMAAFALAAACATSPLRAGAASPDDSYAPLRLYDGAWIVDSSNGKTTRVENHCARTGLFFACEQVLNGKPAALVVFLPEGQTDEGQTYRTQALRADASAPGPWYRLTIDGARWVYAAGAEGVKNHPLHERTVNQFSGPDHIHFEVQTSKDGKHWTTTLSGEERRTR
jgi:hypothetical protein